MVGGDVLRHRDERRAHSHHSGIAREHRTHCAVVIEPIALNVATRVDAVDIGEHAMNADEAFRRNDPLPCADQSVDAGRKAARADEGVETARALGIGAGDDDRRADLRNARPSCIEAATLPPGESRKTTAWRFPCPTFSRTNSRNWARGLIADLAFGLDHGGAALAALRRITDRYERKRHIVGMRRRERHNQPQKSENARANTAKRFQTLGNQRRSFCRYVPS